MISQSTPIRLTSIFVAELGRIDGRGLTYALLASTLSVALDIALWTFGGHLNPGLYLGAAVLVCMQTLASYRIAMIMLGVRASALGFFRFSATIPMMFVPAISALVILLLMLRFHNGAAGMVPALICLFAGGVVASMLSAWPIAQAVSTRLVNPVLIFRASRGMRLRLFGLWLIPPALNGIVPETSHAKSLSNAYEFGLMNGVVNCVWLLFITAVAVAAFKATSSQRSALEA